MMESIYSAINGIVDYEVLRDFNLASEALVRCANNSLGLDILMAKVKSQMASLSVANESSVNYGDLFNAVDKDYIGYLFDFFIDRSAIEKAHKDVPGVERVYKKLRGCAGELWEDTGHYRYLGLYSLLHRKLYERYEYYKDLLENQYWPLFEDFRPSIYLLSGCLKLKNIDEQGKFKGKADIRSIMNSCLCTMAIDEFSKQFNITKDETY
jgi:hypothetical protein